MLDMIALSQNQPKYPEIHAQSWPAFLYDAHGDLHVWTTGAGVEIPLPAMTDRHVLNAHRIAARITGYPDRGAPNGNGAADAAYDTWARWEKLLRKELERRGLHTQPQSPSPPTAVSEPPSHCPEAP